MEKQKKAKKVRKVAVMVASLLIGAVCGFVGAIYMDKLIEDSLPLWQKALMCVIVLAELGVAVYLQIIFHEAGHLIAGLFTGYSFSSFRIGSFMWLKEGDKLKLKRLSLAGTGGQCLMSPPDMVDEKIPFVFYNLGGSLMNLIVAVISFSGYFLCRDITFLSTFFVMMGIIGILFALQNGIPIHSEAISNDGYNAKELSKQPEALTSFWVQMKVVEMTSKGVRLKDMPDEWFYIPDENGMKNAMIATMGVFYENRLMDKMLFDEAEHLIVHLLSGENAVAGVYRNLLICDRMFCELLNEEKRADAEKLYGKNQKNFMKQMKNFPTVIRTEYALALLGKKDTEGAAKIKERFEKCAKTHPYTVDIESERELMEVIDEVVKSGRNGILENNF